MATKHPLLVFSHLRWNFVYQRPQHVLSRLAKSRRILFIEEPVQDDSLQVPKWVVHHPEPKLTVFVPHLPSHLFTPNFDNPSLRRLVQHLAAAQLPLHPSIWTYTPSAIDLIRSLSPSSLFYDCMDELSAFLNAPAELIQQERRLMDHADLVFTGGPSLFRSKKNLHEEVYCFPSSVDVSHFQPGSSPLQEAADQTHIPPVRLGFFGVLDERLDVNLLAELGRQRPHWQIILVGPVVKINHSDLPALPNLHYLGPRSYAQLPSYVRGWDVCLMPFAMNESTRFISPTKVLEYMAAERPIVSTPITDVVDPYGHIVRIGDTAEEFIRQCDEALAASLEDREFRTKAARAVLAETSWDKTAEAMETLMERVMEEKTDSQPMAPRQHAVVVAGAGPTGLSAAFHLGAKGVLIEQNERVGGWCRSVEDNGFTFDFAGHIMFSAEPYVHQLYQMLLGDNVHWQDREAWIFSKEVYTRYPFQGSLYGLPADVIQECIVGAIEARFGETKRSATVKGEVAHSPSQTEKNGTCIKDCCADGIMAADSPAIQAPNAALPAGPPKNFEEFIYKVWGAGIAKHFAVPYNRKLWAVPLDEMETSWLGGRVPLPDLDEMIAGALKPKSKPMGPNARFGYPLRGGFQALMDGFLPHLKGPILLGSGIQAIDIQDNLITLANGTTMHYEHLISTMPLPTLIRLIGADAPDAVVEAVNKLRNVSVRCVNLGVGRERLTEKHWIYYPEDTVFHRIFVQGNASPHCNADGGFGLTCEITYSEYKPLPCDGEDLIDLAIRDCIRVGLFTKNDTILSRFQIDMPYAYVVYDHQRKESVETIRQWLATKSITLAGRYSEWEYYNSDHAFIAGRNAAETALQQIRKVDSTSLQSGNPSHPNPAKPVQ